MKRHSYLLLISILISVLFGLSHSALAIPAYPHPVNIKQPNGEEITILIKGDERIHWMESEDGYSLMRNDDNVLVYAIKDAKGNLAPSNVVARNIEHRTSSDQSFLQSISKKLWYSESQVDAFDKIWELETEMRAKNAKAPKAAVGKAKAICTLIEFSDKPFKFTKAEFELLMNQKGYMEGMQKGSVKDFYFENSYGLLDLEVTVHGPVMAKYNHDYYGTRDNGSTKAGTLTREAADQTFNDAGINPGDFDNDGDGYIDTFHVIFAGNGKESTGSSNDIWSHKSGYYPALTYGSNKLNVYSCSPEFRGDTENITHIGVICHELCHVFGAPDFYDADESGSGGQYQGTGNWDLMAAGSWNGTNGSSPAHINMYQKIQFGWVEPIELKEPEIINDMPNSVENQVAYIIKTPYSNEYYVLENRQKVGFDIALPGAGLLIYHVSVSKNQINNNSVNNGHPQRVYPVCAGSSTAIPNSSPSSYGNINSAACLFGVYKKEFTDTSKPAAFTWGGSNAPLGKPITKISVNSQLVSFHFNSPFSFDLELGLVDNRVALRWKKPTTDKEIKEYKIYRNGEHIKSTTSLTFAEEVQQNGTYVYGVSALYTDDTESNKEEVTAVIDYFVSIDQVTSNVTSVYPNPVQTGSDLKVELADYTDAAIDIYDISGRLIQNTRITSSNNSITIDLPSGIYLIRINTDNGVETHKFTVR